MGGEVTGKPLTSHPTEREGYTRGSGLLFFIWFLFEYFGNSHLLIIL